MMIPIIDPGAVLDRIAIDLRKAAMTGTWTGQGPTPYFDRCRRVHMLIGVTAIYTRDVGHHTSGWWKNPDYERCRHLTMSFFDPETREPRPRDRKLTDGLIDRLFAWDKAWLWCEPPHTDFGKAADIWHYRLFCNAGWQPIKPRGEVYSRELTEAGWKSFSDVQAEVAKTTAARTERD